MNRRNTVWKAAILALLTIAPLYVGCGRSSAPPTRSEVAKAMSQFSMDEQMRARIVASGEKLIPTILEEMEHPKQPVIYNGWSLVRDMAKAGTASKSAPFLRKVLLDKAHPSREEAALMLYWFWDSPAVRKAITSQCTSTPPKHDRSMVWELCWNIRYAASRSKKGVITSSLAERLLRLNSAGETMPLDVIGESSLPLVIDEFDAHPKSSRLSLMYIVNGMLYKNTIGPTAPALRSALANKEYRSETRYAVAGTLWPFPYSDEMRDALIECIDHDTSNKVKAECVGVLGNIAISNGARSRWHINQRIIDTLSRSTRSSDKNIRQQAKEAVERIERTAKDAAGVRLEWARTLLAESGRN